jgi:prepilin-type N-terminal cleavage/methylation domain-containing protein
MKRGEKGYTLIELLVAITVVAVASIAASAGIFQTVRNTERNSNHMAAVLQVQNAEQRITQDAQMAQRVTTDNLTLPNLLVLSWIDGSSGEEYQVIYTLEDMPGSMFKELRRNQSVNGTNNITSLVARQIDSDPEKTRCEFTNGILILTITANIGNGATMESETRTYRILPRPG